MRIKFNWQHLLFSFLALWLIAHGCLILGFLNNVDAAETARLSSNELERLTVISLSKLNISSGLTYTFGQIVGLSICIMSCLSIKGAYINPLVAFILLIASGLTIGTGWDFLKEAFLLPGFRFTGALYYWINGIVMILLGLLCLVRTKRFYKNKNGFSENVALRLT